jgi:hypothetical protein
MYLSGSNVLCRSVLLNCLGLACTRVNEARLEALRTAFAALNSKDDAPLLLAIVERAAARVKIEEQRRLRIVAALKKRTAVAQAA